LENRGTIILEAGSILPEICGVNDANIGVLEELLETRIFSRGNELVIETENPEVKERCKRLVAELENQAAGGRAPTPDLIRAVHATLVSGDTGDMELLRGVSINVPGSYNRIYPRGLAQARYVRAIQTGSMVFSIGPAGTGKTYLAVACALEEVLSRRKRKLVLTRPVVEAGESLGFLPGDLTQKLNPYLRPLYDSMEAIIPHEVVSRLQENGAIEISPLAYMRGRSLRNCVVILDEAQNTTREQMKMFLTRLGEDAKAVVTGDITQIDLPRKSSSGLIHAARILKDIPEIHFSSFGPADVVRNPLIKKIIRAYERDGDEPH